MPPFPKSVQTTRRIRILHRCHLSGLQNPIAAGVWGQAPSLHIRLKKGKRR
jgi:hypothetical protein